MTCIMCLPRHHSRVLRIETRGTSILALSACIVKFAKLICHLPNSICQKKLLILFAPKIRVNMFVRLEAIGISTSAYILGKFHRPRILVKLKSDFFLPKAVSLQLLAWNTTVALVKSTPLLCELEMQKTPHQNIECEILRLRCRWVNIYALAHINEFLTLVSSNSS